MYRMIKKNRWLVVGIVLLSCGGWAGAQQPLSSPVSATLQLPGAFDQELADIRWESLSVEFFGERQFVEGDEQSVVRLVAPYRTENDAFVPVQVHTKAPADGSRISNVYLFVDINPMPLAGRFSLPSERPLEQISTQIRVNGYTYVRAIAETESGTLYMQKQLVKSRGVACSAPPITSPEDAEKNLGKMRFKFVEARKPGESNSVQLMINHPNATGMQKDQISLLMIPEHYVKDVEVSFNDEVILQAETTFSISENPSFRFTFDPDETGQITARITDTRDNLFLVTSPIQ